MPLGPLEPPGWGLPGCPPGVVGGSSVARPRPDLWRAADVRAARPPPPICNVARSSGTPGVGIAGTPLRGVGGRRCRARAGRQGIRDPAAQVPIAMPTGCAFRLPPVCNAARSFGTPGVGLVGMPRRGGRGRLCRTFELRPRAPCGRSAPLLRNAMSLRRASQPSVGPFVGLSAAPWRSQRRGGQGFGSPPRKSRAPCPLDARPVPRPFAMPLGPWEPPGLGLPGCHVGVLGSATASRGRSGRGFGSPLRRSRSPCPRDAHHGPRPFAMPLGPLEPPGWDLPGCPVGVVGVASVARPSSSRGLPADVLRLSSAKRRPCAELPCPPSDHARAGLPRPGVRAVGLARDSGPLRASPGRHAHRTRIPSPAHLQCRSVLRNPRGGACPDAPQGW
ncbi:hypothetical protein COCNU_scaffold147709G000010 [Cocos nucifera]|nr:hypothetical protein [Cocos nucifera]